MSKGIYHLPVRMKDVKDEDMQYTIPVHVIDSGIPLLLGNNSLNEYGIVMDYGQNNFSFSEDGKVSKFKMIDTASSHKGVALQPSTFTKPIFTKSQIKQKQLRRKSRAC